MGLNLGVFGFLLTKHVKITAKQMRPRSLRAMQRFALVCLQAQIALLVCKQHMHLTNHGYFDYGKNPKTPQIQPHAGIKMAQVLRSLVYICGDTLYLVSPSKDS